MGSFEGVADVYDKARHGYPSALRDHLVASGVLWPDAAVVDLGAGTGQLATLVADVAATVTAIDPEPDMVQVGAQNTAHLPGVRWLTGADHDLPLLLETPVDLVLIGNAFHHMNQSQLLTDLDALISEDGAVVVCSSSIPVWLHATDWSAALRSQLSEELARPVNASGVPDHRSDRSLLEASAFHQVASWNQDRAELRSAENIIGEIISSASGAIDAAASSRLRAALDPFLTNGAVSETITTTALIARRN